ncbi:uncharacterized protein CTRU02_214148 [Colletotrichum truncatum]|uniref:Uncharacterized protein n=1 Tax=Colletotrichum truncatum TaxID=5467 RepID=A0ACC3YHN5_COLTU|nr:uncharacterized protein CTRU02_06459 [Colletotrichum truncatum]KAF6792963.1 hypothetical protein CTRU02_06459 [Colletotrichum truncatum]
MAKQVVDEPGPSRPPLRTVRNARNSKHDVPCGENCLIYPKGKFDNTPPGIMGKLAQYLEVDLKTRPSKRNVWVERMGKRKRGGRHKECDRPNRFYPIDEATAEENLTAVDAENVTDGDNGGVEDNGENRVVPILLFPAVR